MDSTAEVVSEEFNGRTQASLQPSYLSPVVLNWWSLMTHEVRPKFLSQQSSDSTKKTLATLS